MTDSILNSTTRLQLAKEKIEKLNSLLYAIRNINQLITREKDRNRLLQGACDSLVDAPGLYSAWISLLNESGASVTFAETGFSEDFLLINEMLHQGELPACGQIALKQPDVVVTEDRASTCTNCPLKERCGDRGSIAVRLEHDGNVYGLLTATIPKDVIIEKQERNLFKEIAGDIAIALHAIELEEKHKQADAALFESEAKFRTLVEKIPAITYTAALDEYSSTQYISPQIELILGFTQEEYKEDSNLWDKQLHPDDRERVLKELAASHQSDIPFVSKYRMLTKNNRIVWLMDEATIVKDEAGEPLFLLGVMNDITERKNMEEQLRQSQKMEAVGTLAGGVAHDFNNLLTVIVGNAQLALMNVIKDESLRNEIEEIKKAGEKAASLTRQLLAFSRKQVIKPEVIDLNKVVNETEKMLKRTIGENIEFLTVLKPELWKAYANFGQIDQIIMNMVINARDAMPQGGKLIIETANADLDKNYFREHGIKGKKPGHYVVLAVSDTGSGMDKETQEHIFEPFFTTKEVGQGTGLGLSTIYGIVKQNNGFVWVYSEPGQGSTFKVYLPRAEGDADSEEKQRLPVIELGGSETVLIVEDDDGLRKLAQEVLQSYGYRILAAENGEEALMVGNEHEGPIHLLLTDVVMLKMGGREAANRLQPLYPQMKVIYMSGYTDNAIVHHGVLAPELNFIQKPFTPEGLARKVREALGSE